LVKSCILSTFGFWRWRTILRASRLSVLHLPLPFEEASCVAGCLLALQRFSLVVCLLTIGTLSSFAQYAAGLSPATGTPAYGSYTSGPDKINLGNLNVNITIPLFKKPGRGIDYEYDLVYDSSIWTPAGTNWFNTKNFGWQAGVPQEVGGTVGASGSKTVCQQGNANTSKYIYSYGGFTYVTSDGVVNTFSGTTTYNSCTNVSTTLNATSPYGYSITAQAGSITAYGTLTDPSGTQIPVVFTPNKGQLSLSSAMDGAVQDANGNQSGTTDTAGVVPLTVNPSPSVSPGTLPQTLQYVDPNGNTQTITIKYQAFNIQTAFGVSGISEYSGVSTDLPVAVVYPDGTSYTFTYEQTPGLSAGYTTGRIASITLPTSGTISYTYVDGYNGIEPDGTTAGIIRTTSDGPTRYDRSNVVADVAGISNGSSTTTITDALSNQTVLSFIELAATNNFYEISRQIYSGGVSGTPLRTITMCYNSTSSNCNSPALIFPFTEMYKTTALETGLASVTDTHFNNYGNVTALIEYDFGAPTPTRQTITTYASLGNNILDKPYTVIVQDGGGNPISSTTYGYDEYALTTTSGLLNHAAVTGARGNRTSQHQWVNTSGTTLDTHWKYDDAGQVLAAEDARTNWTTYTYDPATDTCLNETVLPTPAAGISLFTSQKCDPSTGLKISSTDVNNILTSYSYNSMLQSTGTTVAGGAAMTRSYSGASLPETITTTIAATPNPDQVSSVTLDPYGRTATTVAASGATVATKYDALGRVHTVSNPYYSGSTQLLTTYTYDALGRVLVQAHPDALQRSWSYSANTVTFTDEDGNQWKRTSDALGRLTQVLEPGSTSPTPTLETDYTYNVLNNLLSVNQKGTSSETPRMRSFTYDSLSRLLTASNPETGTICYGTTPSGQLPSSTNCTPGYDANSNLVAKTDGRGVTTTYAYDSINRLLSKTYTNDVTGTASSCYQYDQSVVAGAGGNLLGHVTNSWTQVGTCLAAPPATGTPTRHSFLAYDAMGHALSEQQCTPTNCATGTPYAPTYTYDLAGNLWTHTNGVGTMSFTNTYDSGNHLLLMQRTDTPSPVNLFSTPSYAASGGLTGALFGAGLQLTRTYDSRLRISGETDTGNLVATPTPASTTLTIVGAEQTQ
jgi:YD repeat-containing protein